MPMDKKEFDALIQTIEQNTCPSSLELSGIDDAQAIRLAKALESNLNLESLILDDNQVGDAGAIALAKALEANRRLITLELANSQVGAEGKAALEQIDKFIQRNLKIFEKYLELSEIYELAQHVYDLGFGSLITPGVDVLYKMGEQIYRERFENHYIDFELSLLAFKEMDIVRYRELETQYSSLLKSMSRIQKLFNEGIELHYAIHLVRNNHLIQLRTLLQKHPGLAAKTLDSHTLLHFAAPKGHANAIPLLRDMGCALDATNVHRQNALHIATLEGKTEFARRLLSYFGQEALNQLLEAETLEGRTPIQMAVIGGRLEALPLLLSYKANVNHQDKKGRTLFHLALDREKSLEFLLKEATLPSNTNLELSDEEGCTTLHRASESVSIEAIRLLSEANADLEAVDNEGNTPLHRAIGSNMPNRLEAVKCLIRCGANTTAQTKEGFNAIQLAVNKKHMYVANYIQSYEKVKGALTKNGPSEIHNWIFSGGSVRGIGYLGVFQRFEQDRKEAAESHVRLKKVIRIAGTSAGAITATLLSIGTPLRELEDILDKLNFKAFLDEGDGQASFLNIKQLIEKGGLGSWSSLLFEASNFKSLLGNLQQNKGIFKGKFFRNWIEDKIYEKTKIFNKKGIQYLTFGELAELRSKGNNAETIKHLYLVGVNVSTGRVEVFSHEDTPDMVISDAVRISMSIPLLFAPHQRHDKVAGRRTAHPSGHLYVDGGVSENYPIWMFDKSRYLPEGHPEGTAEFHIHNTETLGFRLVTRDLQAHYMGQKALEANTPEGLIRYVLSIVSVYLEKQESEHALRKEDQQRTIYVDTMGVSMLDFDLTEENKRTLVNSGYRSADEYLAKANRAEEKAFLSKELLALLISCSQEPLVCWGQKGTEIKNIKLDPNKVSFLLYQFYTQERKPNEVAFLAHLKLNINAKDREGNTAAHLAVKAGDVVALKRLLRLKISINAVNISQASLLDLACELLDVKLKKQIIQELLKNSCCCVKFQNIKVIQEICQPIIKALLEELGNDDEAKAITSAIENLKVHPLISPKKSQEAKGSTGGFIKGLPLFHGVTPVTNIPLSFNEFESRRDGSCGFYSLGISRETCVRELLELANQGDVRQFMAHEIIHEFNGAIAGGKLIASAFSEGVLKRAQGFAEVLQKMYIEGTVLEEEIQKLKLEPVGMRLDSHALVPSLESHREGALLLKQVLDFKKRYAELHQAVTDFCEEEETYQNYVKQLLPKDGGWLGIKAAILLARKLGFNLYIWYKDKDPSKVVCHNGNYHYDPANRDVHHLLHTDGATHFNLLAEPIPTPILQGQATAGNPVPFTPYLQGAKAAVLLGAARSDHDKTSRSSSSKPNQGGSP